MQAEGAMLLFARREKGYMMRSERRSSYNRSPRRKRPRRGGRGYAYGVFALIVSIVAWPFGMLLLWTKKLRWGGGVKFLASLLTLVLCLCWIGWALTVQTDDWRITSAQDKINGFLADSAEVISTRASKAADDVASVSIDVYEYARVKLSDGILAGASLAGDAKDWVSDQFAGGSTDSPEETGAPSESPEASAALVTTVTPSPTPLIAPTGFLADVKTAAPTVAITETPASTSTLASTLAPTATPAAKPTATPTLAPTASIDAGQVEEQLDLIGRSVAAFAANLQGANGTEAPTNEPTAEPTAEPTTVPTTEPTAEPTPVLTAEPAAEPTAEPTMLFTPAPPRVTAEPTMLDIEAEPTPAPTLKPAGLAIVYHTSNGVGYHIRSTCVGMSGAKPYTLEESVAAGYHSCGNCHPADESLLATDEPVVWVDENDVYHTSDECAEFEGQFRLMTLKDAYEKGATPCAVCGAESYIYTPEETAEPTPEPTAEPTPEPTAEPTPEPTAEPTPEPTAEPTPEPTAELTPEPTAEPMPEPTVSPVPEAVATGSSDWMDAALSPTLKPAGEATVYHTSNGRAYHVASTCVGMSRAKPYTLAECVADGYRACGHCDPAAAELVNEDCAWVDEAGLCHVSDECESFEGQYKLVPLEEAISEGLEGCPICGMGDLMRAYQEKKDANEAQLMELAKSVTVYYNDNSTYYHTADSCVHMPSADAHTLYDALEKGLKRCDHCEPPTLGDLMDQLETGTGN